MIGTPYTIKLFMPNGNPNSIKIIEKMNWTGLGIEMNREDWNEHKSRPQFNQAGIYILIGYNDDTDLPQIYIGQGDGVKNRIESHTKEKDFWDRLVVFVSSNHGLNRAHITWLEWALVATAQQFNRCELKNANSPNEPILTESEKADTQEFLNEILSILPLVDIKVFTEAKRIKVGNVEVQSAIVASKDLLDTVVVPAQSEGFKRVFLGENCWHAIRISSARLNEIKYIAAYQTAPISAITHYAEVDSIETFGDGSKYKVNFKGNAIPIEHIKFGSGKSNTLQGPRYTTLNKLLKAKKFKEVF